MPDRRLVIAQAIAAADRDGPTLVAKSDDYPAAWDELASAIVTRFGPRPAGVACPDAVFATPFGRSHVAVVQVADRPAAGGPRLGFRFLILGRKLYEALGDPFAIADRYAPDWSATGPLPSLTWPAEPAPRRTVDDVQAVLKGGDMPLLLGGAQALIDGSRLMLAAGPAAAAAVRGVWSLLPDRTRIDMWPATFAFSNDLGFHVVAVLAPPTPRPAGYLTADQARDYPEGRYELSLQTAAEAGDQAGLDQLFARRSSRDTLRLALALVVAALVLAVVSKVLSAMKWG